MKKHLALLFCMLTLALSHVSCRSFDSEDPIPNLEGNIDLVLQALEKDGFVVQEGAFAKMDPIELLNRGLLRSANGNNSGTPYFSIALPLAPGQTFSNEFSAPGYPGKYLSYHLRADEVLLFIGRTPPEMLYFSYRSFLLTRFSPANGQQVIYGALGDTINNATLGTGNPFNQPLVIITAADASMNRLVRNSLVSSGFSETIVYDDKLPGEMLNMGLASQSDSFTFLSRTAIPRNQSAFDAYLANPGGRVFRLTPRVPPERASLYPRPVLKPRGTGKTEAYLQSSMNELRAAILNRFSSEYVATEYPTSQWLPETLVGIDQGFNVIAESRDTPYLWTSTGQTPYATPTTFILPENSDDFLVVYGVNHQVTGKATYSGFVVYGATYLNGVAGVNSPSFAGSAEQFLPGHPQAGFLYAWKIARKPDGSQHCLVIPMGPQHYGFGVDPDDQSGFVGFRAYLEPATTVGADWSELLFDRVIKFEKRR